MKGIDPSRIDFEIIDYLKKELSNTRIDIGKYRPSLPRGAQPGQLRDYAGDRASVVSAAKRNYDFQLLSSRSEVEMRSDART